MRALFHHLSEADVFTRFFRRVRGLSDVEVQRLCNLNYENEVAFVATTGSREEGADRGAGLLLREPHQQPGARPRSWCTPSGRVAASARRCNAAMVKHAKRQGLRGFVADILPGNERMLRLARNGGARVQTQRDRDSVQITTLF